MTKPSEQIAVGSYDLESMSAEIRQIQAISDRLMSTGLNRRTVILLIHDASGVGKRDIGAVLDGLKSFAERFLVEDD